MTKIAELKREITELCGEISINEIINNIKVKDILEEILIDLQDISMLGNDTNFGGHYETYRNN